jgi:hypothetical protein
MKRRHPIPLIAFALLLSITAWSQQVSKDLLQLKSGTFSPQKNISDATVNAINAQPAIGGQRFFLIQFDHIPNGTEKAFLSAAGVELLEYVPANTYTVSAKKFIDVALLTKLHALSVFQLEARQKMATGLASGHLPSWAVKTPGTVDVWISFPHTLSSVQVIAALMHENFRVTSTIFQNEHILALRIEANKLDALASLSYIDYVQPAPPEDKILNYHSRNDSRANVLNASAANGGYDLNGEGVVIGIGDNATAFGHIDVYSHVIDRNPVNGGSHGVHVMGTAAGAGIVEEKWRGYAPKSTILSQSFSGVIVNAASYVQDYDMVITNNSYGNIIGECNYNGVYDLYSRILDQQAFSLPHLTNVFASGNSGADFCSPYPSGFHTVLGGYQTSKNPIDVGNTTYDGIIITASSKGPVNDGRIKPEITTMGTTVTSCWPANGYIPNTGTSMSAPGISGGMALLYQRYRQLHANADPSNALMKALLCNGATDMGNPGPDYSYGFGWMNLLRSVDMLNNNHYINANVNNGGMNTHSISIPANTAAVKVMLYWNDPAANVLAAPALVNDLDLEVVDPASTILFPYILDPSPANVNNAATTGADHLNNIEQVVINNPAAGTYTIHVKGFAVPVSAPQDYYIVYDIIPASTTITHPIGGEKLLAGDLVIVQWESYGNPSNPFTLSFTNDNWATWTDSIVPANLRQLVWPVPNVATDLAHVRVTRNGTAFTSTSNAFTIMGRPSVSLSSPQCAGYINLTWTAVTGATDYEVMMMRGEKGDYESIATTTATSFTIPGLSKDSIYWVSVRARINGNPGMRSSAFSVQPNSGTCAGTISDNDLTMDAIIAPASGRLLTSTALSTTTTISARIKNLDDVAVNNFTMKYNVNGGAWVSEAVSATVIAGSTYTHNFSTTYDFSTAGVYVLKVVVKNTTTDPVASNDTMTVIIKQLDNPAINLVTGPGFLDDMETGADSAYYNRQIGLAGLDRYDFVSNTTLGRLRPFVNSGIAFSGTKALTLDADRFNGGGTVDSLTGTFNLASHNANTDDIRLDFRFKNHGQGGHAANHVWIRGDDQKTWIDVYDLAANQNDPGSYKKSSSIEIGDILLANGQNFSTSFQVRWGQWGQYLTADNDGGAGYSFDDVHLYKVTDDMQMLSIDTPTVVSCGLNATTPVKVTVRNSSNAMLSNIPLMFRVDGGGWVTETLTSLAANTSTQYLFTATANLSTLGTHLLETKVAYVSDSYNENDTLSITLVNAPVINIFPYLQNFESGNGSWYATGKNSSWEYGTPASTEINKAASGIKAWKTRLAGNYNDQEFSYLYSPCFDLTGMTKPTLSFSLALDLEDCGGGLCDAAWVEYSTDGVNWLKLGSFGTGTNWYNKNYGGNQLWSASNYSRWHVATAALPLNISKLHLRFVMNSDAGVSRDGIAVDDIHIYDNIYGIYTGASMGSPVTQNVSGNAWIDFIDAGSNQLVASIQPNNQNLGSTDAKAFINTGAERFTSIQYYHDRNITIIPANPTLVDSATVRFYFLDSETENLLNATGCVGCTKPGSAYELGVSKYTNQANRAEENGSLADNTSTNWRFIASANVIKVPFDKGYYAEFKVKDFSEFWLNNGYLDGLTPLPLKLISFTATKKPADNVLVEWKTSDENNVNHFDIEVARTNREFQLGHFETIGQVASHGNLPGTQQYQFTDLENNKTGVRYYRLKIVDNDASYKYSEIRPVVFGNSMTWQVYPNPSNGLFYFQFQQNAGEPVAIKVYDVSGKIILQQNIVSSGFPQKLPLDLRSEKFAAGIYLIKTTGEVERSYRVIKQ